MPALNAEFGLQSVVSRPCSVFTVTNVPEMPALTSTGNPRSPRSGARRNSSWNKRAEAASNKPGKCWVRVHRLEIAHHMVAHVANFEDHLASQFTLHAQRPFLSHRFMEVRSDAGIITQTWIDAAGNIL